MSARAIIQSVLVVLLLVGCHSERGARGADTVLPRPTYASVRIDDIVDMTGAHVADDTLEALRQALAEALTAAGMTLADWRAAPAPVAVLKAEILSCPPLYPRPGPSQAQGPSVCLATIALIDDETSHVITESVVKTSVPAMAPQSDRKAARALAIPLMAKSLGDEAARRLPPGTANLDGGSEDISAGGLPVGHQGEGRFLVGNAPQDAGKGFPAEQIDLARVAHAHDPAIDVDVPIYTNTTFNDRVPPLVDGAGNEYAVITLYQVDPPLADLPSRDPGIPRGMDFRDPANLVKSTYSNYVSPVLTFDVDRHRVPSHPIGHFFVKMEIPGYPTVLTGMTTISRADTELEQLTVGRQLGIGGVLLTPEPGRIMSAAEALRELTLRQRRLRVIDGLHFRSVGGRNVGPEFTITDGNVVFARFRLPVANAKDAMAFFAEYLRRGTHNIFGSLINRPNKATGAGCTPFAMAWLEASGVIPFVSEPAVDPGDEPLSAERYGSKDFWRYLLRSVRIPWKHIGCDDRVGAGRIVEADLTVYDLLFYHEDPRLIAEASEGLAEKIRQEYGFLSGTLFQLGALTPLRDLVVNGQRKDPNDIGDYGWAEQGKGLDTPFWDNARFSTWIKRLWATGSNSPEIALVREGRFLGIEVDAMQAARQAEPFFAAADRILEMRRALESTGKRPNSCQEVFALGLQ